nr:uncharacterized protein LOC111099726 isoform X3 [Crassostrea virginica]
MPFYNNDFYKYPACLEINLKYHCYAHHPSCSQDGTVLKKESPNVILTLAVVIAVLLIAAVVFVCIRKRPFIKRYLYKKLCSSEEANNLPLGPAHERLLKPNTAEYPESKPESLLQGIGTHNAEYQESKPESLLQGVKADNTEFQDNRNEDVIQGMSGHKRWVSDTRNEDVIQGMSGHKRWGSDSKTHKRNVSTSNNPLH